MYVYTGTLMRDWPYRRKLVPSIGHRFPKPMGSAVPDLQQNLQPVVSSINLVRVAVLIAIGAVVWKAYDLIHEKRMQANLPSFPGIGPLFNVGAPIGPAYNLGPWIL